jgi:hypothetical protein
VDGLIFAAVVAARVLIPLGIPRYPLPVMLVSLAIDGIDQTIFHTTSTGRSIWRGSRAPRDPPHRWRRIRLVVGAGVRLTAAIADLEGIELIESRGVGD